MIILIFAFVIESALLVYCLITHSRQAKTRGIVRISEFALFLALVCTSVIKLNFRWYGLAVLLFILAARGLWSQAHHPNRQQRDARPGVMVARTIATLLLTFVAISPALLFPPYETLAPAGPYRVATDRYTFIDQDRLEQYSSTGENRQVNVVLWYPENAGDHETFPLVVFSHGGLSTENSNASLYLDLASHGYVVCSIVHPYHAFWTTAVNGRITFVSPEYFGEIQQEDAGADRQRSFTYYQKWMATRTADINFILDTLLTGADDSADDLVYRLIDTEHIGVMGHSLGGAAALGIPRQRDDIDVVIALESPYLYDITGVENGEFVFSDQDYPVPVLNVYSDSAWPHLTEWPQYARNHEYLVSTRETIHNQYLEGAGHFSLTDLGLASPFLVRILEGGKASVDAQLYLENLNQVCLEFLNQHLKNG